MRRLPEPRRGPGLAEGSARGARCGRQIEDVDVPDLATGERVKFPGSPVIRIDGVDIEPGYEDSGDYTPR